jgi:hypothetical protein
LYAWFFLISFHSSLSPKSEGEEPRDRRPTMWCSWRHSWAWPPRRRRAWSSTSGATWPRRRARGAERARRPRLPVPGGGPRGDPAGGFDVLAMHHPEGEVIILAVCLTSTRTTPCSAGPASAATWRHVHQKMEEVALD